MVKKTLTYFTALIAGLSDKAAQKALFKMQESMDYLIEENRILREELRDEYGCKRLLLNDSQKRRLAAKGIIVGKKVLANITTLFQPETILGWHRKLIAQKYDGSKNRRQSGKPRVSEEIIEVTLKIARNNPSWGYTRISNVMATLDLKVSPSTVRRILDDHGIVPDPELKKRLRWKEFVQSHLHVMAATDFFSVEVFIKNRLVRYMVIFVIDIATRKVEIAGIRSDPDGEWMKQIARNLNDCFDGFLLNKEYIIHDRDPLYTKAFDKFLKDCGVEPIRTPPFAPDMNAYAERFVQTIKHECLNNMILTSEEQLHHVIKEFMEYYHHERPHMGLDGSIIEPLAQDKGGKIVEFSRLGGLLKFYRRVSEAA